jgi:hypothetical protein
MISKGQWDAEFVSPTHYSPWAGLQHCCQFLDPNATDWLLQDQRIVWWREIFSVHGHRDLNASFENAQCGKRVPAALIVQTDAATRLPDIVDLIIGAPCGAVNVPRQPLSAWAMTLSKIYRTRSAALAKQAKSASAPIANDLKEWRSHMSV